MKKYIFILSLILSVNCCFATSQYSTILDNIENSLFGYTYSNLDDASRLSKIEETVYGETKNNKTIDNRISALKKDISADSIGQEITPKEDTFAEDQNEIISEKEVVPSQTANVDYPSINELEKAIFNKEFKNQNLSTRLSNLEKEAFKQSYDSNSFSERVERLQAKVKPKSFMNNSIAQSSNDYYTEEAIPLDKNYNLSKYSPKEFDYDSYNAKNEKITKLSSVEKSIFKRTFNNDNMENRLSRLESTMFGTTFNSDSQNDRLKRISSAYKATKSSGKYDSNKFSQNMATAMQIGTILLMILACVL